MSERNFKLLQSPVVQSPRDTFWVPWILCVETNSIMARRKIEIYSTVGSVCTCLHERTGRKIVTHILRRR